VNSGIQEPLFQGEKALFAMLIRAVFCRYLESRNTMFRLGDQFLVLKGCRFGRCRNRACSGKGSKWAIYRLKSGSFMGVSGWAMDLGSGGGSKQGLQEVMENGTFGVGRWLCKVMFEGYLF